MPELAYTLDCPTETDPPEGTALLHGTRFGTFVVTGYHGRKPAQNGAKAQLWIVACGCGAYEIRSARRIQQATERFRRSDQCPRCLGRGIAPGELRVSDHAIVRWLERVGGASPEALRGLVVPHDLQVDVLRLGPGTYPIDGPDGSYRIVVSENTVVTVLAP